MILIDQMQFGHLYNRHNDQPPKEVLQTPILKLKGQVKRCHLSEFNQFYGSCGSFIFKEFFLIRIGLLKCNSLKCDCSILSIKMYRPNFIRSIALWQHMTTYLLPAFSLELSLPHKKEEFLHG